MCSYRPRWWQRPYWAHPPRFVRFHASDTILLSASRLPHPSARPETRASAPAGGSGSHHHDGPRGPSFPLTIYRGHGFWSTNPLHWIRTAHTAHTGRGSSPWRDSPRRLSGSPGPVSTHSSRSGSEPLPTHPWRPYTAQSVFGINTGRVIPHHKPAAEPYYSQAGRQAEQAEQAEKPTKNPKTNQSQPRPTASRAGGGGGGTTGPPVHPPPLQTGAGVDGILFHVLDYFPSCTWGTGGGEPPPIPRIRIPT